MGGHSDLGEYRREYPIDVDRLPGASVKSLEHIVRPFKNIVFKFSEEVYANRVVVGLPLGALQKQCHQNEPDTAAGPSKISQEKSDTERPKVQDVVDVPPEKSQKVLHWTWREAAKDCYDVLKLSIKSLEHTFRPLMNEVLKSSKEDDKKPQDIAQDRPKPWDIAAGPSGKSQEKCDKKTLKLWDIDAGRYEKSQEKSHWYQREAANKFEKKQYYDALKLYTEGLKYAPINSDGFGSLFDDRSRLLFYLYFYRECLEDLDTLVMIGDNSPEQIGERELRRNACTASVDHQIQPIRIIPEIPVDQRNPTINGCSSAIKLASSRGYMVATRDITVGEVLLVEEAFMSGPIVQETLLCSNCMKICLNPTPCPTCSVVAYCSRDCEQFALENYHRYEVILSHLLEKNYWTFSAQIRMVLRLRNYDINIDENIKFGQGSYEDAFNNVDWRASDNIEDTYKTADDVALLVYTVLAEYTDFLEKVQFGGTQESKKDILKGLLAKMMRMRRTRTLIKTMQQKTVDNKVVYETQIGSLFPAFSHFQNSCAPNAMRSFSNNTVIVRAIEEISLDEPVTVHYEYLFTKKCYLERQKRLKERWNVECMCIACTENWMDLKRLGNEPGAQEAARLLMDLKKQVSATFCRRNLEYHRGELTRILQRYIWPKPSLAYGLYLEVCEMLFNKLDLIETPVDLIERSLRVVEEARNRRQ